MVLLLDVGGHKMGAQVRRDTVEAAHMHYLHLVGNRLRMVLLDGARHPGHLSCSAAWDSEHLQLTRAGLRITASANSWDELTEPLHFFQRAEHSE